MPNLNKDALKAKEKAEEARAKAGSQELMLLQVGSKQHQRQKQRPKRLLLRLQMNRLHN